MTYPQWVYVAMYLAKETEDEIKKYIEANLQWMENNDDLHITVCYSRKNQMEQIKRKNYRCEWSFKWFDLFWADWKSLVIKIDSPELVKRNKELTDEFELISDYPDYQPHVSISYSFEWDINALPKIEFPFIFEHEIIENINEEESDDIGWTKDPEESNEISEIQIDVKRKHMNDVNDIDEDHKDCIRV